MIDQRAEIIRVLALMGLAEEWHVESDPNNIARIERHLV